MDHHQLRAFLSSGIAPDLDKLARDLDHRNLAPGQVADEMRFLAKSIREAIGEKQPKKQ